MTGNGGHERWKEQLPAYLLGSLDPAERAVLEHHLSGCAECQAELEWLSPATGVLADDVEQIEPSPALRSRVMAAVDADLEADPVPGSDPAPGSEVAAGISSTPERGSIRSRADSFGTRRGWLTGLMRPAVVGAVAMALFVGVALGVVLNGGGDSPSSPSRQVITGQSTIGADAVMVASDGTGTLKMTNLRGPDDGQVYQAWIQRGQEIEPTESLFVPNRRGSAVASIPDVSGVTAVMVSSEPKGGSPQPTSAPVITVSMPG
ncbi:MAG: anti-sigma factor [Solirubrobacterales bacterium]|nr:anti-sigma factor [Solirubrobacterales bacterium]